MPEKWGPQTLPFMAVGRVRDCTPLAYISFYDEQVREHQTLDVFQKILGAASAKLSAGQRTRLQWADSSVCCMMDQQGEILYCVVTADLQFPERMVYQMLYDLVLDVQKINETATASSFALNDELQPKMAAHIKRFEDMPRLGTTGTNASMMSAATQGVGEVVSETHTEKAGSDQKRMMMMVMGIVGVIIVVAAIIYGVTQMMRNNNGDGSGGESTAQSTAQAPASDAIELLTSSGSTFLSRLSE